jgi:serine/threonine protein kinase
MRLVCADIKPANIFVTKHAQAKVLDFGLAKLTVNEAGGVTSAPTFNDGRKLSWHRHRNSRVHESGTGTGQELDGRTDLFSFGAMLYEMCTGWCPSMAILPR